MSSMQAGPWSRPLRRRRSSARFSRQSHWRSISKPLVEAQTLKVGAFLLFAEGIGHAA